MALPLINLRFILLISASFIAIFSSIAIYFCLPILISHIIRNQITLSQNSGSFNQWRTNSVFDSVYLFNITNLDALISADEATTLFAESTGDRRKLRNRPVPRLKEVGPFTYRQDREKLRIKFDRLNETVTYDQKKSWQFIPELSIAKSTSDLNSIWINHISVSLSGTTLNPEYAEFVDPVIIENDLKLFLNHSVGTLLFDGYYDLLMEQAKANGQIDVDRFGWLHNQNNTVTKSIRIFTGPSNETLNKFGSVDEFDNKREFQIWHRNNSKPNDFRDVKCNQFRLSSAGEFFPPPENSFINHNHLSNIPRAGQSILSDVGAPSPAMQRQYQRNQTIYSNRTLKSISLFLPDLCRSMQLFYNGSHEHKGLYVDRYIANENTYKYWRQGDVQDSSSIEQIESNRCYCTYNETSQTTSCPPNGMMDLFNCRKGSPVTISFPYFLYSKNDPTLEPYLRLINIEEDNLNPQDHAFFIDLESTLNVPVKVQIVLQFNVHLRNEQLLNFTKEHSYLFRDPLNSEDNQLNDFYLPQMWIKSYAEIDDYNLSNLKFIQRHLGLVTPLATIIIFGCASILLLASAKLAYDLTYGPNSRKPLSCDEESCSSSNHQNHLFSDHLDEKKKHMNMKLLSTDNEATDGHCYSKQSNCGDQN